MWLKDRNIKSTTINIYLKGLKCIFRYFRNKKYTDITINLIKEDVEEIEVYTDEEIAKLIMKPNINVHLK